MVPSEENTQDAVISEALTIEKAGNILQNIFTTNIVPFLWGPPGIGKSTLVRQLCKDNDWDLIDLRLSLLNPVDLRGLPVIDRENRLAEWFSPAFLPNAQHKKNGILFLDEINLAPIAVQAAAYQLILDKKVGDYVLPSHWKIVAAGNRETDKANVYKLSAPLANRFIHFTIVPELKSWGHWAKGANIREEVIGFVYSRPTLLFQMPKNNEKAFPTPRSWEFVSQMLDAFKYDEGDTKNEKVTEELELVLGSAIGVPTAKEFIKYLEDFNLRTVKKTVDDFIQTGKLTLPVREISTRQAIFQAIIKAWLEGQIDEERYQIFNKQINKEEKQTLNAFKEQYRDQLEEKYNRSI